ncbi:hypothetical protein FUT83_05170 [Treponema phagedenis]|uniref:Uncharacterized protein n=1 Tax=Treponema phagedenis TaxID=162 RepID=A0AAE6IT21_TREPH|nr:hypothetical protein FUT82_06560 [Treponema phagedenis]QEK03257.1 hypothetical protein FUT83_05170 [Treponema phagedenis]QEK08883.1 hypothetical protein FUT81_05150 [Treponema phagedenis]
MSGFSIPVVNCHRCQNQYCHGWQWFHTDRFGFDTDVKTKPLCRALFIKYSAKGLDPAQYFSVFHQHRQHR